MSLLIPGIELLLNFLEVTQTDITSRGSQQLRGLQSCLPAPWSCGRTLSEAVPGLPVRRRLKWELENILESKYGLHNIDQSAHRASICL